MADTKSEARLAAPFWHPLAKPGRATALKPIN